MFRRMRMRDDEGTVAVLAAVTIPVVLLVLALALATLVWAASETEEQRAADSAATEIASSQLLIDYPNIGVDTLARNNYPTVSSVIAAAGSPALSGAATTALNALGNGTVCSTVGSADTAIAAATGLINPLLGTASTTLGPVLSNPVGTIGSILPTLPPAPVVGQAASQPKALPTLSIPTIPVPTISATLVLPTISVPTLPVPTIAAPTATPTALPTAIPTALPTTPTATSLCSTVAGLPQLPTQEPISRRDACKVAEAAMSSDNAPYSTAFADGNAPGGTAPTCANKRIRVGLSTQNPLVGFGTSTLDTVTNGFLTKPSDQLQAAAAAVAPTGVRLDTALPNLICPQVNVEIDQPVREPILQHVSSPNGRATAQRIVKNAVVVPVFNGLGIGSASGDVSIGGTGYSVNVGGAASAALPPMNLNPALLGQQQMLINTLDSIDPAVQKALTGAGVSIDQLNGTLTSVGLSPTPLSGSSVTSNPVSGAANSALSLTGCLKDTLNQIYNPPTGSGDVASTQDVVNQVFKDAAASGDPIELVQTGVVPCANTVDPTTGTYTCLNAATGTAVSAVSGLYDVPFFDVTPVVITDLHNGNYSAVPVHATQANGAFRSVLVRDTTDHRYDPSLPIVPAVAPTCTPVTSVPVPSSSPAAVPAAVCASAVPAAPSVPVVPTPTLPVPVPTLTPAGAALSLGLADFPDAITRNRR